MEYIAFRKKSQTKRNHDQKEETTRRTEEGESKESRLEGSKQDSYLYEKWGNKRKKRQKAPGKGTSNAQTVRTISNEERKNWAEINEKVRKIRKMI